MSYGFGLEEATRIGLTSVPGLPILPAGTERYTVQGGGSRSLQIAKGDRIQVIDREGLQPGEIVLFDANGVSRAGFLGSKSSGSASGLQSIIQRKEKSAERLGKALKVSGCDLGSAEVIHIFQDVSDIFTYVNSTDYLYPP